MLILRTRTDSDAVQQDSHTIAEMLRKTADKIEDGERDGYILDTNGRPTGMWLIDENFEPTAPNVSTRVTTSRILDLSRPE